MRHENGSSLRTAIICGAALLIAPPALSTSLREIQEFGSNPGNLRMLIHVPEGILEHSPLVVVVHGCFQSAREVADSSGWVETADTHRFALLFPETSSDNEPKGGCFRTWQPDHQRRGAGEPLSMRQMISWMLENYPLDPSRVFITGMSSGGLMSGVMLATYPEVFAGGALQSAYPYKCATSFDDLLPCSQGQRTLTPEAWGDLVRSGHPGYSGPRPRVSLWHGAADPLILPVNLRLQVEQWTDVAGVDRTADELDWIDGHLRTRFNHPTGHRAVETYMIRDMEHAIAVNPNGTPPCGVARPFFADAHICAAMWIARWFDIAD